VIVTRAPYLISGCNDHVNFAGPTSSRRYFDSPRSIFAEPDRKIARFPASASSRFIGLCDHYGPKERRNAVREIDDARGGCGELEVYRLVYRIWRQPNLSVAAQLHARFALLSWTLAGSSPAALPIGSVRCRPLNLSRRARICWRWYERSKSLQSLSRRSSAALLGR
jgi:hypothetical protein